MSDFFNSFNQPLSQTSIVHEGKMEFFLLSKCRPGSACSSSINLRAGHWRSRRCGGGRYPNTGILRGGARNAVVITGNKSVKWRSFSRRRAELHSEGYPAGG